MVFWGNMDSSELGMMVGKSIPIIGAIMVGWCLARNSNRKRLEKKKHQLKTTNSI